jgi:hypothetical protein
MKLRPDLIIKKMGLISILIPLYKLTRINKQ